MTRRRRPQRVGSTPGQVEINRRIVEGYTRMPQGGECDVDEWGDLSAAVTALTAELLRSVTEEEEAEGFEPWSVEPA